MSEDFDKEAEREKLREKYGDEDAEREATQHMSELLLKGATMTNQHCPNCGDPIFRHDGQAFCPTCNRDAHASAAETDTNDGDGAKTPDSTTGESTPVSASRHPDQQPETTPGVDGRDRRRIETDRDHDRVPANSHAPDAPSAPASGDANARDPERLDDTANVNDPVRVDGDAVAQVEATLERFAAAASRTDDPARARECLAVVRDATATLQSLRAE